MMMDTKNASPNIPQNVDEYLADLSEAVQQALETLRQTIRAAAPQATETISYQIPTYKYFGPLVHFFAKPNHLSFTVVSRRVVENFKTDLAGFKTTGRTIHFSPEKPLPSDLVRRMVQMRMVENEEIEAMRKSLTRKKIK